MNRSLKKSIFAISLALLVPVQADAFFKSAFNAGSAWLKNGCGYVLNSSYSFTKKSTIPAIAAVGVLATVAAALDLKKSRSACEFFKGLMTNLEEQRKEKKLSSLKSETEKKLLKKENPGLAKLIEAYNNELALNNSRSPKMKVKHEHVIDYYESGLANGEFERLDAIKKKLLEEKAALLADSRLQIKVKIDYDKEERIADTLARYLPFYDKIINKHHNPGADCVDPLMNEAQAQSIITELERACSDCITHMETVPIYRKLYLEKIVRTYLNKLQVHANEVKQNVIKLRETSNILKNQRLQLEPTFHIEALIRSYHNVRDCVAQLIRDREAACAKYNRMLWERPLLAGIAAAIVYGGFHLIKKIAKV